MSDPQDNQRILAVPAADKYRTVDELFERSRPSSVYYTMLILSVVIVTAGLLLKNMAIVIGGMLVAPMLTPILTVALGLEIGRIKVVKGPLILVGKSAVISIAIALALTFIFGAPAEEFLEGNNLKTAFLYSMVSFCAGIAGTFAWTRKEISDILPGTAIAVALVPPLAQVGIWLSDFKIELARFYGIVFILNLLGIMMGSLLVFSFLKFYRIERKIEEKAEEIRPSENKE